MRGIRIAAVLAVLYSTPVPFQAYGQEVPGDLRDGFLGRFEYAANRYTQLAEALPEDVYSWTPNEGGMSVERVFMHIVRYNYWYPESSLGVASPEEVDLDRLEDMTGKETVLEYLGPSMDHVREVLDGMSDEELAQIVSLYGRDTQGWNVLLQLQVHMAEHLGQLMAYSRANDIVPPWSR